MSVVMAANGGRACSRLGTYLLLQRKLSRIIVGLGLIEPRRQRAVRQLRSARAAAADRTGRPGRVRRSDAAGARVDGDRDQLRHDRAAARAGVPELAADGGRRGRRRHRGPHCRRPRVRRSRNRRRAAARRRGRAQRRHSEAAAAPPRTIRSEARDEGAAAAADSAAVDRGRGLDPGRPVADGAADRQPQRADGGRRPVGGAARGGRP